MSASATTFPPRPESPTRTLLLGQNLRQRPYKMTKPKGPLSRAFHSANHFIGFRRSYNLPLWIIFGGAFFAYCLSRIELLSDRIAQKVVAPGEWYWYKGGSYNVGLKIHTAGMIVFGLLSVFQFVPRIRKQLLTFHRINGYIVLASLWVGCAGGLMITTHAFGGTWAFQMGMGFLTVLCMSTGGLAYTNILSRQIDQHRKWMLRTVVYVAAPISARLLVLASIGFLPYLKHAYYTIWRCDELAFTMNDPGRFDKEYPTCGDRMGDTAVVAVLASLDTVEQKGSGMRLAFSGALWLGIAIHVMAVEVYIHLTPGENERLRQLSYEKQLEAGLEFPGSSGWTGDRLGDGPRWMPERK